MAIKAVSNFSGELPAVPVWKDGVMKYCHNQKELDRYTKPIEDGGLGWSIDYQHQQYPKLMSHPSGPDVKVRDAKEQKEYEKKGYSFDHWENKQAKEMKESAVAGSFDPKAQARIDELEKQNRLILAKFETLMAKFGE